MLDIPPALLQTGGTLGVVLAVFWAIATGRLVTRREHAETRADRDEWRRLYNEQVEINRNTLIPLAEFTAHAFGSVADAAQDKGERRLPSKEPR